MEHMKVSYNFVSLVAIGNFNPAILSLGFLTNICELNLGDLIEQSPPEVPIHRYLQFQHFRVTVDMDRLVAMETGVQDITKTRTLEVFDAYYRNLPHTPLVAVGVNINCNLFPETDAEAAVLGRRINEPKTYLDFFSIKEIDVTEKSKIKETDKSWKGSRYRAENVRGLTRIIDLVQKKNSIQLNYNYEAGNLRQNDSNLKLLKEGYEEFCSEFFRFIRHLEG